jgi:hypothetical protein
MSLPTGNEKEYLEVTPAPGGFTIEAEKGHSSELQALYRQYGIPLEAHPDVAPGKDELVFTREADISQVRDILEAYKNPKGS